MLWRRRSPQKHNYEPRLCENVIIWTGSNGKRQISINCHNGKNCRFAHSREEILYNPSVYKTLMCESSRCTRYYCPFAHSVTELMQSPDGLDYVRSCMGSYRDQRELFTDESSSESEINEEEYSVDSLFGSSGTPGMHTGLRMRKASNSSATSMMMMAPRLSFSNTDWASGESSGLTANSWVTVTPTLKVESVVRAHSPVANSELCRAVIIKAETKKGTNSAGSQQALAKVMHIEEGQDACYVQMSNELQSLCRSEHKNLLSIKKVHAGRSPTAGFPGRMSTSGTGIVLCIAFEQCSTSIYQLVVDGYRGYCIDGKVRSVARRLNPHDGTLTPTAVSKIGDLLSAIQRLHFIGVCHLRICPTNILVDSEACFKLADFLGKYKLMYFLDREPRRDYAAIFLQDAVVAWCAPELVGVLRACEKVQINGKKADVWAMGACIFFMMTGQHPFGTFADEEKFAAAGALGFTASSDQLFIGGVDSVVTAMLEGNMVNQHLLYDIPLVMDLLFRMLGRDPASRMDTNDLTRHPIFWDFSQICGFITSLPLSGEKGAVFRAFAEYSLAWDFFLTSEERSFIGHSGTQTVLGLLQALQGLLGNSAAADRQAGPIVLRILQRHPLALIRAWDASRLEASPLGIEKFGGVYAEAFSRGHLGWMEGKNATSLSHEFVREYYSLLACAVSGSVSHPPLISPEKQTTSLFTSAAPMQWSVASSPVMKPQLTISRSANVWQPPVQTPKAPLLIAPSKEVIRQVAAASAALSTIFENPSVVPILAGCSGEPTYSDKLTAAAAIYINLLASNFTFGGSEAALFDTRQLLVASSHQQSTAASNADDESLFFQQEQLAEQIAATLTQEAELHFGAK